MTVLSRLNRAARSFRLTPADWLHKRLVELVGEGPINTAAGLEVVAGHIARALGCDVVITVGELDGSPAARIEVGHDCPTLEIAAIVFAIGELTPRGWATTFVRVEDPEERAVAS